MKAKSSKALKKRASHRAASDSGRASARATRRQVSTMVLSTGSPAAVLWRYFMSQICWDRVETGAIELKLP